jgi:antitoxin component YwqK of YwqJK toxin-antitoxin module
VKAYYQNGNISTEYEMKNDDYDGTYKIYHPNGKLQEERFYECGLENKPNKKYFNNGNLKLVENMLLNDYHGEFVEYNLNGTLRMKENYLNNYLNGLCEYYDTNGKLLNAYYYVDGELLKIIK